MGIEEKIQFQLLKNLIYLKILNSLKRNFITKLQRNYLLMHGSLMEP